MSLSGDHDGVDGHGSDGDGVDGTDDGDVDGVDGTDDGDGDYHQLDNHQGEHADCRGRSLTLVPATTEGRIIKSLSVLSDDGRDDDFVFSLLIIIKMVVVIAAEERVIKNLLILYVYRVR